MSAPDVGVVIVAAGSSSRTADGELKQFKWIAGRPMLLHSLQLFQERADVAMVVCVVPQAYAGDPPPWIFQSDSERLLLSVGGRTRAESVRNGIADLPPSCGIILVHDAARPLVPMAVVDRVVDAVRAGTSAIAALPVVDTLKEVDADGRIVRTVAREELWRAQTPQGFPRDVLLRAHRAAMDGGYDATDDAALVERIGEPVVVVRGSERAMKVTEAADFGRAEAMHGLAD
ncbi:MAG: 2-C-methyl-D-erythritol 4-phosphate cytidylyltransferase [Gemmatimonadaceae bacterium]